MARAVTVLLVSSLLLGACSTVRDSRFNPFNWFGRSTSVANTPDPDAVAEEGAVNPLIPGRRAISIFRRDEQAVYAGRPIGQISELLVERTPTGAIVRATGVADRMGPYDVRLVKLDEESSATQITYEMRNLQGPGPQGGSDAARSVTAAAALTQRDLEGVRTIRVKGARNTRSVRRR